MIVKKILHFKINLAMVIVFSTKKISLFPFSALVITFNLYCSFENISFLLYEMEGPILRNNLIKLKCRKLNIKKKYLLRGLWNTWMGPESKRGLYPWRYPEPAWALTWASCWGCASYASWRNRHLCPLRNLYYNVGSMWAVMSQQLLFVANM